MSFLWDSVSTVSSHALASTLSTHLVTNPENPELAIIGEGRGAATLINDLFR